MEYRHVFGQVFGVETAIAAAVFCLVMLALVAAVLASRYRRTRGQAASSRAERNGLELGYVLVLAGIAAFLVTLSFISNGREARGSGQPLIRAEVNAFQWCWRFSYAGQPRTVRGQCEGGPAPTLVLPAGRPVRIDVKSSDVIHAFWIPGLRYKMDAFPGHVNSFTLTLNHSGRWEGRCAEYCGLFHYEMEFYVQAVSPAQFDRYLHTGNAPAASGA